MVVGLKAAAIGVTGVSMVSLLSGIIINLRQQSGSNDILDTIRADEGGAVAGRIVSVPVKVYRQAFKATLKLGQCPLVMDGNNIKTCSDEFVGDEVLLAKGSFLVDVSKVESSEDILLHIMGGVGASIGVLGLASVSVKVNVAVTTETSKKTLNLISSYEMSKGILSMHNPRPKTAVSNKALFLSEIELGGSELLLVTLEFESEKQKVDVQVTITFKILFISITAKLRYVHTTFKSKAKVRIQFKSTFREELDETFTDLGQAIPRVEELEKMYMKGPQELRDLSTDDDRAHNFYYFSSWKESPYGTQFNLALIHHDLDFLNEQNTEMKSILGRISRLMDKTWPGEVRQRMVQLNRTLTDKTEKLTNGLDIYHNLSPHDRQKLRDLYGEDKAPQYYQRFLDNIIS